MRPRRGRQAVAATPPRSPSPRLILEDLERLKKIRAHRGIRHYWGCVVAVSVFFFCSPAPWSAIDVVIVCREAGPAHMCGASFPRSLRVRGQKTKTTGRRGRTVGVSKKKGG